MPVYFEKHYRENFDSSNYTDYVGGGCIYYGAAGCGKTTKLVKLATKATNPVILSFINEVIENIKSSISEELRDKCHTFDSYICDYHGRDISSLEGKTVFIEEYTMTPNKWMTKIYQAFTKVSQHYIHVWWYQSMWPYRKRQSNTSWLFYISANLRSVP